MKMRTKKEDILNFLKALKPSLEKEGIDEIGLFGSFAKEKADIASDIDIFIKSTGKFCNKYLGFEGLIYLDELRQKIQGHFKRKVDLCDIASFSAERTARLLKGAIYV